jgi:hypothetical protein
MHLQMLDELRLFRRVDEFQVGDEAPVDALGDPNIGLITHVVSLLWSAIPRTTSSSLHHATCGATLPPMVA